MPVPISVTMAAAARGRGSAGRQRSRWAAQGLSVIEAAPTGEAAREIALVAKAIFGPLAQRAVHENDQLQTTGQAGQCRCVGRGGRGA